MGRKKLSEFYPVVLSALFLSFLCACHRENAEAAAVTPGMQDKWAESIRSDHRSWERPAKEQSPVVFASEIRYEESAGGDPVSSGNADNAGNDMMLPAPAKANEFLPAPGMYKVVQGDTLWGIAEKMYGKGWLWRKIYEANLDRLRNPSRIRTGMVLEIPGGYFKSPEKKENRAK